MPSIILLFFPNKLHLLKVNPGIDPIKLFFLFFLIFVVKLGHFTINDFFKYVTNTQDYRLEKILRQRRNKVL
jgi:hypothetical protein